MKYAVYGIMNPKCLTYFVVKLLPERLRCMRFCTQPLINAPNNCKTQNIKLLKKKSTNEINKNMDSLIVVVVNNYY